MALNTNFLGYSYILIPLLLMMSYTCHSFATDISDDRHGHHQPQKVNLTLYYETLCPDCQSFIVHHLVPVFNKTDLMSIVNLHLVPFGNAHIVPHNKHVYCQHGPLECYYNTIETCALNVWPLNVNFPFIHCVETGLQKRMDKSVWESCAHHLRLNPKSIQNCYTRPLAKKLILHNAEETGKLNPPHKYVPWVTVNNKPLFKDYNNFIKYICNAYTGNLKPRACKTPISTPQSPSLCDPPVLWNWCPHNPIAYPSIISK